MANRDLFDHAIDPVLPKTRSTEEAMRVLAAHRRALIEYGRYVATVICRAHGSAHSRDVRRAVGAAGMLTLDVGDYWLGAVFNRSQFVWTGEFYVYSDESRNIHERTIKIWRLRDGAPGYSRPEGAQEYHAIAV